jgi:hypothetical protein
LVYETIRDRQAFLVIDGLEIAIGASIGPTKMAFSPDGKRFAYVISGPDPRNKYFPWLEHVVIDGQGQKAVTHAENIIFSPDSKHYAYIFESDSGHLVGDGYKVMVDGTAGLNKYAKIGRICFSDNGAHCVYPALKQKIDPITRKPIWVANIDGKESEEYDFVDEVAISPDGERIAFKVARTENHDHVTYVIENGKPSLGYRACFDLRYTVDGRRLAFIATAKSGQLFTVVGGRESGPYPDISAARYALGMAGSK